VASEKYDQIGGAAYAVQETEAVLSDSELLSQVFDFDVPEAELQIYEVRPTGNNAAIFWYAQQAAQHLAALPDSVRWKPQAAEMKEAWVSQSYFYGDDPNFCGYFQLYIQADDLSDPVWAMAGTMEEVTSGEYAGWGVFTMGVTFYYDWDSATYVLHERFAQGDSLILPSPVDEAPLDELLHDMLFLTTGSTMDSVMNAILTRFTPEEVCQALADFQPDEETMGWEARVVSRCLGQFLKDYGGQNGLPSFQEVYDLLDSSLQPSLAKGLTDAGNPEHMTPDYAE
jgi:hypothetical protein